ncbi:MAG: glycosyltransferase [Candidatus Heimdallarchaeum aukensis]|uniref:Glycosyltransferase n=1 Tax=Candidatus Heimdallarchaeum aukensis TaxID=2876573 RepID=A0A9Y1BM18_9ARCH|nr:MAG: glycosyltransferase [Candidatus Heimdallarchaeum aukensis]
MNNFIFLISNVKLISDFFLSSLDIGKDNMKILVLQETDWELRGPHQQHHLMERLSVLGHEVKVIDYDFLWKEKQSKRIFEPTKKSKATPKIISEANIELIRPGMIKIPLLSFLSIPIMHFIYIYKEIKQFQPDFIIGFGILNSFIGQKLSKIYKIPFIYYLIDHLHTLLPVKPLQYVAKAFEKRTLKNCDKIYVINHGLLDYSVSMGANLEKGVYIPGGVDLKKYSSKVQREQIRKRLGIVKDDIVLMFMGWLYEFSGLKELTDYMVKNEDDLDKYKLLIVGKGDLFDYISIKRKELKNPEKIILTGQVPFKDIPIYLQAADYYLLPAHKNEIMENIVPIKLYEYLAAGNPVICTKLKGVYKEFGENNGILYIDKPTDVYSVVNETLDLKDKISEKGLNFVSSYDWDSIVNKFIYSLESLRKQYLKKCEMDPCD